MPTRKPRRASLRPTTNPYLIKLYAPFKRPLPIPAADVFDEPTIQLCVNEEWAQYLLGALQPLQWDDLWQGTDLAAKEHVLGQVQALVFALMGAGSCAMIDEIRVNECSLQVRYRGSVTWVTVGDLTSCAVPGEKGDKGDPGEPGADGLPGAPGADGQDGASVELRKTTTHIQWRQDDDDPTWGDLVALADLKGAKGDTGATGATGAPGPQGEQGPPGPKGDTGDSGVNDPGTPPGEDGNDKRCGVAIGLTTWIQLIHEDHMTQLAAAVSITEAALDILQAFPGGAQIAGLIAVGTTAASIGISIVQSENNTDFWEDVRCKLYCLLPETAEIDEGVITSWANSLVGLNDVGYQPVKILIESGITTAEYRRRAYAYALEPSSLCESLCDECSPCVNLVIPGTADPRVYATSVTVNAGDRLIVTATGTIKTWSGSDNFPPNGGFACGSCVVPGAAGGLVGKIGSTGTLFYVGANYDQVVSTSGVLYLGTNDDEDWSNNSGQFNVEVCIE